MSSAIGSPRVDLDSGGMARVSLTLRSGGGAQERVVAVKEMHPHLAKDRECQMRFLDEARITSRVRHPNVVEVLDIVQSKDGLAIVMEYVHGASLSQIGKRLMQRGDRMPRRHVSAVVCGVLSGLHAAHEAKTEGGEPLGVVHRDVTPRNILIGADGVPRLIDFGIARAALRDAPATRTGVARGTPYYMAPEQLGDGMISRSTDIFLCGLILWELVTGRKLSQTFQNEGQFWLMIAQGRMPRAREYVPGLAPAVEAILDRALAVDPWARFASAEEMRLALEEAQRPAPAAELGAWLAEIAADDLSRRERLIASLRGGEPAEPDPEDEDAPPHVTATSTETATATRTVTATTPDGEPEPEDRSTARPAPAPQPARTDPLPARPRTDPLPPRAAQEPARATITDERTTTPLVRPPAVGAAQHASGHGGLAAGAGSPDDQSTLVRTVRRRSAVPIAIAGSLLFLGLGVLLGITTQHRDTPADSPPPALSIGITTAPVSAPAEPPSAAPQEPVPAASAPVTASASSASAATSAAQSSAAPSSAAGTTAAGSRQTAPAKPASGGVCTYQDAKKITRISSCADPECTRRGRACKPVGQR